MYHKLPLALLTMILLVACGSVATATPTPAPTATALPPTATALPPTPTTAAITLTDDLGRNVVLPSPAQHIVSLAPSNTEILFAVGAGSQVVGRDTLSDYPPQAKAVADIGGSMGNFNTEAIVALHPDLVLVAEINAPELVASLEKLGLTVYYLKNPVTLEGMYANLETVGTLTGHAADAATLVASLKARVAAVDAKVATAISRPSVYYELDGTDPTKPYTSGGGTFVDQLIQRAGGVNVFTQLKDQWPQISLEQLLVDNPQIIILGDSAYGETPDKVIARSGWGNLQAVKNKQVFPFDDNLVSRPGPRLVDGLEALARLIHPELFK
ncbi:MAG: cobalamin-binding protein [Anaerolineales bacterium]|jgi:iron complex transport system substrate-binding protein